MLKCEDCNDKGWIDTYNCQDNCQEIQKCDSCNVYKTDEEARNET